MRREEIAQTDRTVRQKWQSNPTPQRQWFRNKPAGLKPLYLEAVSRVERLHRRLLDLIKDEFDRMGWDDINPVQALLMFNIGDAEMTAGELRSRGYYLGSNVSYNLKKLVETGYIFQERSRSDRRRSASA